MKLRSLALFLVLLLSLSALSPAQAAFSDVSDAKVLTSVETLRSLGVVDGFPDGTFRPEGTLNRAQFCKMAVSLSLGDAASASASSYQSFTIFPDVKSSHWAAGYINLAVRGENRFISGYPDGTFRPDEEVTWGQAVTILMRLLGYQDADMNAVWPDGYLASAAKIGLTDGLSPKGSSPINRGEAAILFRNMLSTHRKGTGETYLSGIAATVISDTVLLSVSATAADGSKNAVETVEGVYRTATGEAFSSALSGQRGALALDSRGRAMTFLSDPKLSYRSVVVSASGATYVKTSDGSNLDIPADADAYTGDGKTSYDKLWPDLAPGRQLVLCYNAADKVEYVFAPKAEAETAMVAKNPVSGNPFAALTGRAPGFTIYKNGLLAGESDLRRYDVATYDAAQRILSVCDQRVTGVLEAAHPNLETPTSVKLLGHSFPVLSSAYSDFKSHKLGDSITLLLTTDGQVAGAVSSSTVRGESVGVVTAVSASSVTVDMLNGMTVSGKTYLTEAEASRLMGQLVSFGATRVGELSVSRLSANQTYGVFDVAKQTVGSAALNANAQLFDQAGGSMLRSVRLDDIGVASVPARQIKYAAKDYAGRISMLVLDDVTGDSYDYGRCTEARVGSAQSVDDPDSLLSSGATNQGLGVVTVTNGDGTHTFNTNTPGFVFGEFYGVAGGPDARVAATATLSRVFGVPRSAFSGNEEDGFVYATNNFTMRVSDRVQCYIKTSDSWVDFAAIRAFSDDLTIYYDRTPDTGGKIRLIVA